MLEAARWGGMAQARGLILAGSAAGIAAAFNTPLAGIVFAIEEMSRTYEARANGLVLTAVILSGLAHAVAARRLGTSRAAAAIDRTRCAGLARIARAVTAHGIRWQRRMHRRAHGLRRARERILAPPAATSHTRDERCGTHGPSERATQRGAVATRVRHTERRARACIGARPASPMHREQRARWTPRRLECARAHAAVVARSCFD